MIFLMEHIEEHCFVQGGIKVTLKEMGQRCKIASKEIMNASQSDKNNILKNIKKQLILNSEEILNANQKDVEIAKENQMSSGLLDRLMLDQKRIDNMIVGIDQVIALKDPIGEIENMHTLENGLQIAQMRVAIGVIGIIYEARPNVSVDAAILCLKSGNAVMLRGSKDIIHSNMAIVKAMRQAIRDSGFNEDILMLIEDTTREVANEFMRMYDVLDVLIPRGGASLIKSTIENATVPVLETGTGNCHVYIDGEADLKKAYEIVLNAKTTRTSVCNACESVLIHDGVASEFIEELIYGLQAHHVKIHGDDFICTMNQQVVLATDEDYGKEYLDLEISIKMVESLEEAIQHINHYSTHHSESIISKNYDHVRKFIKEVDSACVYANASTRFSDGFEFGLGAEIGISTQKLHARGPMGLTALTSQKYIILGEGQIR